MHHSKVRKQIARYVIKIEQKKKISATLSIFISLSTFASTGTTPEQKAFQEGTGAPVEHLLFDNPDHSFHL